MKKLNLKERLKHLQGPGRPLGHRKQSVASQRLEMSAMPHEDIVNEKFNKLLDVLNVPPEERSAIINEPLEEKWNLICMHENYREPEAPKGKEKKSDAKARAATRPPAQNLDGETPGLVQDTPQYYLHALKEAPTVNSLVSVRVLLKTKPASWIATFLELGGLQVILDLLVINELKRK
eukprot:GEZU01017426.1.p1 GENE.GEZU01017426.1~~GEZU01017426.1.p1  ORF type:complete len:178 (-),score=43.12 GEZU01017426.1:93-626(-)